MTFTTVKNDCIQCVAGQLSLSSNEIVLFRTMIGSALLIMLYLIINKRFTFYRNRICADVRRNVMPEQEGRRSIRRGKRYGSTHGCILIFRQVTLRRCSLSGFSTPA